MATISVSLPSDGTTADVADINTPITTIVNAINGGLDDANIKSAAGIDGSKLADATITNAKLSTAAGEIGAAHTAYTPTVTAGIGSFTTTSASGRWTKIGKTVFYSAIITITAVGTGSEVRFTLPLSTAQPSFVTCFGREDGATGKMIQGKLNGSNVMSLFFYDNTAVVANGHIYRVNGWFEVA